ncbi:MAG: dephospho-CoA kinase [Desulfarculus sp.]|nr:dephospho-CoA kinase [Desulfarculus sp.]
MLEVGLTGGIASGKSTVAAMFVTLGAHLVDTDLLARQAVEPGGQGLAEIVAAFGPGVLGPDGGLDRRRLREMIFSDPQARARLDAIVHPRVGELLARELAHWRAADPEGVVLVDVPLLFEAGWAGRFAAVVLVYVPRAVQIERLMKRDGVTREQAEAALAAQMDIEQKRGLAQFVVDNSGAITDTHSQVRAVWAGLCALAGAASSR